MNAASSTRSLGRRIAFLACLALQPALACAAGWDLDQLLQSLAKTKVAHATFVEKKYMSMLNRPVESSGELRYAAPDRLEKRTVKPKPETMLVDGDTVVVERGRFKHTLQLQEFPELAGFIDSIRGTLAGDRKALERSFRLKLDGDSERWTLTLSPTDAKLLATVQLVEIGGARDHLRSIHIVQADGDRTVMAIEHTAAP